MHTCLYARGKSCCIEWCFKLCFRKQTVKSGCFILVLFLIMNICLCISMCMWVPVEARRECWILWNWNLKVVARGVGVLGTKSSPLE